jgi:hypothetical protein
MRFESKKQKVIPFKSFAFRLGKYGIFSFLLIVISITIGVIGYKFSENISWLDSFHMACMILTGMGPTIEIKSTVGKLFSSFYALYSGIAFLSITAVFFAPIIHRLLHILHVEDKEK